MSTPSPTHSPDTVLLDLMRGYRQSYALYTVVQLRIAELLQGGSMSAEALAKAAGCNARALARLLRALASSGVFVETAPAVFAHSPLSEHLRRDHPQTRVPSIEFLGAPYTLQSWAALLHGVQSGSSAFEHVHGSSKWQYNELHPKDGAIFDQVMAGARPARIAALVQGYDFSASSLVVDVGGGRGQLLAAVLAHHPQLSGVLYDLPSVVAEAPALLDAAGVASRCRIESGSFFGSVPEGDTYLLSDILHDWPDEQCLTILRACRASVTPTGRVLVLEQVLVPCGTPPQIAWLDLQMMVEFGEGRQRSLEEFSELFEASGFRLASTIKGNVDIIVAEAR